MPEFTPIHFLDEPIIVNWDSPPIYEKAPPCPQRFTWNGADYPIAELLAEWSDFTRKGRAAKNMRPTHAAVASGRGSLGVGRFFFRVRVQSGQVFDIYYDREIKSADDRKGHWVVYRELQENESGK
jgi:hypothetical protein